MATTNLGQVRDKITSIEKTSGTGAAGTTDTYTIKTECSPNGAGTFTVYNGADGQTLYEHEIVFSNYPSGKRYTYDSSTGTFTESSYTPTYASKYIKLVSLSPTAVTNLSGASGLVYSSLRASAGIETSGYDIISNGHNGNTSLWIVCVGTPNSLGLPSFSVWQFTGSLTDTVTRASNS